MKITIKHLACLLAAVAVACAWKTARAAGADAAEAAGKASDSRAAAAKGPSIFKRSQVHAWFDGPDDYLKYDTVNVIQQTMDIVDELDLPRWKAYIDHLHAQGKLFCAFMMPQTHLGNKFEYVMNDPGLQDALCLDFNFNPMKVSWMASRDYKQRSVYFSCTNHPRVRAFLRHQIFLYAEAGADGIVVDKDTGTPGAFNWGGCFCPYCMAGFREYLRTKYTPEQWKARGIDDLDKFDYRQVVLKYADDRASFEQARRLNEIPLAGDFQGFLQESDMELWQSLQEMASKLSGKRIPWGMNNYNFSLPTFAKFNDMLAPETTYQSYAVEGMVKGVAPEKLPGEKLPPAVVLLDKLAEALGKWYSFTPSPRSWGPVKEENMTGVLRLWVAASYANGGLPRYPRKGWCMGNTSRWYYPPKEDFEPLYHFVTSHRELFDDYEGLGQVGVVFPMASGGPSAPDNAPVRHICESLVNLNVPFEIVVAGAGWVPNRLSPEDAKRFDLLLIPKPTRLDAGQQQVVEGWKSRKAAVLLSQKDDVGQVLAGRVDPLVALESESSVWLFPRAIPDRKGEPVVCHLLNWDYDAQTNRAAPQQDVKVRLRSAIAGGSRVTKVTYHTIAKGPQSLEFAVQADGIHVTVPEVELWGILRLELENAPQ